MSAALVSRGASRAVAPLARWAPGLACSVPRAAACGAGAAVCSSVRTRVAAVAAAAGSCCVVAAGGWGIALCEEPAAEKEREGEARGQSGEWRQDWAGSGSLGPFLSGLGVPGFAVVLVDAIKTDLSISCDGSSLVVVDRTLFGKNTTEVVLGAEEVERSTRTGRKKFMLSGFEDAQGWLTVQCRLFQRGPGWLSQQSWRVREDGVLEERMLLKRPGEDDIVVLRLFNRRGGDSKARRQRTASQAASEATSEAPRAQDGRPLALVGGGLALAVLAAGLCIRGRPSPEK